MITRRLLGVALNAALVAGAAALVGCNQQPSAIATSAPAGSSTAAALASPSGVAQQAPSYTPPTADQLYQLVAPIALFPDKLVAQVLAGSTYPDQVSTADTFLEQNQSLQGSALQDAVDSQSWDPGIKGLTVFPKVLDQMAQNIPWTTALGNAYANDPTDVLNAIQVMRQRAATHGSLRSSAQLRVVDQPAAAAGTSYAAPPDVAYEQDTYDGPDVVPAPQQTIEILPADSDTVYVPEYDPDTVYGGDLQAYPGYRYERSGYSTGDMVATGAIAFGAGIVIASLFEHQHHDQPNYGWNSWGMQWHGDERDRGDRGDRNNAARWQRPAVVHNDTVYVSRSTTINNRYVTNNIHNSVNNSNNRSNSGNTYNRPYPAAQAAGGNHPVPIAPAMLAARAANRPTAVAPANTPSPQSMRRPDFNGALTKGAPARFAHPEQAPAGRPVATPAPGRSADGQPHAPVNMAGVPAQRAARSGVARAVPTGQLAQPNHPAERNGSMRVVGQHTGGAIPAQAQHAAPVPTPVARPFQHETPSVPHAAPMPRPQVLIAHHAVTAPEQPRATPARRPALASPAAAPQRHEAPHQEAPPVREAARPRAEQAHAAPRPQPASQPAAKQQRGATPAKKDEHPKKKDEQNH